MLLQNGESQNVRLPPPHTNAHVCWHGARRYGNIAKSRSSARVLRAIAAAARKYGKRETRARQHRPRIARALSPDDDERAPKRTERPRRGGRATSADRRAGGVTAGGRLLRNSITTYTYNTRENSSMFCAYGRNRTTTGARAHARSVAAAAAAPAS